VRWRTAAAGAVSTSFAGHWPAGRRTRAGASLLVGQHRALLHQHRDTPQRLGHGYAERLFHLLAGLRVLLAQAVKQGDLPRLDTSTAPDRLAGSTSDCSSVTVRRALADGPAS
jgi:hypothetical protein